MVGWQEPWLRGRQESAASPPPADPQNLNTAPHVAKGTWLKMKIKDLEMEDPGLAERVQCNHKAPYKSETRGSELEKEM